ncbi:hypothetical protein [Streptomyces viridochromogenes]|uniref:hypothetical protein n=1 Tax=Streptomyces viridochromogenes TaxID=1938 RepID=UPI00131A37EB|nr:hypothetical protein [Streptomyces viridochromogenes]
MTDVAFDHLERPGAGAEACSWSRRRRLPLREVEVVPPMDATFLGRGEAGFVEASATAGPTPTPRFFVGETSHGTTWTTPTGRSVTDSPVSAEKARSGRR